MICPRTLRRLEIAVVIDATSGGVDRSNCHVFAVDATKGILPMRSAAATRIEEAHKDFASLRQRPECCSDGLGGPTFF